MRIGKWNLDPDYIEWQKGSLIIKTEIILKILLLFVTQVKKNYMKGEKKKKRKENWPYPKRTREEQG